MNLKLLVNLILAVPRGHFVHVAWERPAKVKKSYDGLPITKRVEGLVRVGIDYNNVKDVKECRADGSLPKESNNGRPCWFHYPEGMFPFIAKHNTNGTLYACFYFAKDNEGNKTGHLRSSWFRNGEPVSEAEIADVLIASEKNHETDKTDNTFHTCLENITRFSAEGMAIDWRAPNYQPLT
jgi:hypothetical protein